MNQPPVPGSDWEALAPKEAPLANRLVSLANVSGAAIRLDALGRISEATPTAASMLGYEPRDLQGRTLKDLALEGWQDAADVATARVRFGSTDNFELALRGRSGRRTLVEMNTRANLGDGLSGVVLGWSERRVRRGAAQERAEAAAQTDSKQVAYGLLRTQEAERLRVALELHDQVTPMVVMVKYMIEDACRRLDPATLSEPVRILGDAAARLREVMLELSRISTGLRPKLLDDLGLIPALEWYCRGVEETAPAVEVAFRPSITEAEVPGALKLDIFRIVQEALSNVVEHSGARTSLVSLYIAMGELCVLIEDDGQGFDPGTASSKRDGGLNLGLQSIRKRIDATGGRFLWEPSPRGARIGAAWRVDSLGRR